MGFTFVDLWCIVDVFEATPPCNVDTKVKKEYQRHVKKAVFIIALNLAGNQLAHIRSCKGPTESWKVFCNIHKAKSLLNILYVHCNFFTSKHTLKEDKENLGMIDTNIFPKLQMSKFRK